MKNTIIHSIRKFRILAVIASLSASGFTVASQTNFDLMVDALYEGRFRYFKQLLSEGADPNFIGTQEVTPEGWVGCLVARFGDLELVNTFEEFGGNLNHVHTAMASHEVFAIYTSALTCSVLNDDIEVFKYAVQKSDNPTLPLCFLCKDQNRSYSIFFLSIKTRKYDKSLWLLRNTDFAESMINDRVIKTLNSNGRILPHHRVDQYWEIIDHLTDLGYELSPNIDRELK